MNDTPSAILDAPRASTAETPTNVLGLLDAGHPLSDFRADVLAGLGKAQKQIPPKYLYDTRGSELFDQICRLEEYYLTRTEIALLHRAADAIARLAGPDATVIELGSGASRKTRILLDALEAPAAYVPIDISRSYLLEAACGIARHYPELPVKPVCADFTQRLELPDDVPDRRRLAFFPGSTIGNFTRDQAVKLLAKVARGVAAGGDLVIGADLVKDEALLLAAYDDSRGVTAAFNLNLLRRINRELDGDFNLDSFRHEARFNRARSCIEMHLVSEKRQTVSVSGRLFAFEAGESIHSEDSHKFTIDGFRELAQRAGWAARHTWRDGGDLFSLHCLSAR